MFFVAMISFACITVFSSCSKDEIDVRIVDVTSKGTVQFIVRGYAIGTTGTSYVPEAVEKNQYVPVEGVKVTFANGQVLTTDKNGKVTISLETGYYIIDKIDIPNGYYFDYDWNGSYDYVTGTYIYNYILLEESENFFPYWFRSLEVYSGYQDIVIRLYKR